MGNLFLFHVDERNRSSFDTIATVIDDLCDGIPAPEQQAIDAFLEAQQRLNTLITPPIAEHVYPDGSKQVFYSYDPAITELPKPVPSGHPHHNAYINALRNIIAVDFSADGKNVFLHMDPFASNRRMGIIVMPRQGPPGVASAHSKPLTAYIEDLLERGPVDNQPAQLRILTLDNGTQILVRLMYFDGALRQLPLSILYSDSKEPELQFIPEDHYRHLFKKIEGVQPPYRDILEGDDAWRAFIPADARYFVIEKSDLYDKSRRDVDGNFLKKPHPINGIYLPPDRDGYATPVTGPHSVVDFALRSSLWRKLGHTNIRRHSDHSHDFAQAIEVHINSNTRFIDADDRLSFYGAIKHDGYEAIIAKARAHWNRCIDVLEGTEQAKRGLWDYVQQHNARADADDQIVIVGYEPTIHATRPAASAQRTPAPAAQA